MKRAISIALSILLSLSLIIPTSAAAQDTQIIPPSPPEAPVSFTDVPSTHWAHWYINGFARSGVLLPAPDGQFDPSTPMSRGDVVYYLLRALGTESISSTETDFTDVPTTDPRAPYISWAHDIGIIKGMSDTVFGLSDPVTRQDLATILDRCATLLDIDLPEANTPKDFTDAKSIADYAAASVSRLQRSGIINGYPDGTFAPSASVSRAETIAMLWRFIANPEPPTPAPPPDPNPAVSRLNSTDRYTPLELNRIFFSGITTDEDLIFSLYLQATPTSPATDHRRRPNNFEDPIIQVAAAEIAADPNPNKLRATYDYVLSHMYYKVPEGVDSIDERASATLDRGYGRCENYCYLTVALLNAQGIPAINVDVWTPSSEYPDYPMPGTFTVQEAAEKQAWHAIVLAYYEHSWHFLEPTWGDITNNANKYFNMSLEALSEKHLLKSIRPSGNLQVMERGVNRSLTPIPLTIDGTAVADFYGISASVDYYGPRSALCISLEDFAFALKTHSTDPAKVFTSVLGDIYSYMRYDGYIFVGGSSTGTEMQLPKAYEGAWATDAGYNTFVINGSSTKSYFCAKINTDSFDKFANVLSVDSSIIYDICAALNISVSISGTTITIDTSRPYVS